MSVNVLLTWLASVQPGFRGDCKCYCNYTLPHHSSFSPSGDARCSKTAPPGTLRVGDGDATAVARYLSQTSVKRAPAKVRKWAMRENRWPV